MTRGRGPRAECRRTATWDRPIRTRTRSPIPVCGCRSGRSSRPGRWRSGRVRTPPARPTLPRPAPPDRRRPEGPALPHGGPLGRADPVRAGPAVPARVHPAERRADAISFFALEGVLPSGVALLLAAIAGILLVAIPGSVGSSSCGAPPVAGPTEALTCCASAAGRCPSSAGPGCTSAGSRRTTATHLGHAATFVWGDLAARGLRHAGVDVEVCRNVTDVDDVLDAAAARAGSRFDSFAAVQQFRFDRDMAVLGVRRPTHEPRAHNHVGQVVALAEALLEAGAAYERGGSVWFRGAAVPREPGWMRPRRGSWRGSTASTSTTWEPPAVGTTGRTSPSGVPPDRARGRPSPHGRARGATVGRAGTPSARRWR